MLLVIQSASDSKNELKMLKVDFLLNLTSRVVLYIFAQAICKLKHSCLPADQSSQQQCTLVSYCFHDLEIIVGDYYSLTLH